MFKTIVIKHWQHCHPSTYLESKLDFDLRNATNSVISLRRSAVFTSIFIEGKDTILVMFDPNRGRSSLLGVL